MLTTLTILTTKPMKKFRIFLLILIIIGVILLLTQKFWVPKLVNQILIWERTLPEKIIPSKEEPKTVTPPTITTKKITEENFSSTVPVILGSSAVAVQARAYIDKTISEFRKEANNGGYEINIDAKYIKSDKTESIVLSVYSYTGGAHGSSIYKVITVDIKNGKILALSDVIKKDQQKSFTEFVKKELNAWRYPDGGDESVVFPETVKDLTFSSFSNWSLEENENDKNLIIYFDQATIGPGVLGPVAWVLPQDKIKDFLQ
ncbi:MAG: hypothetical protein UU01_C0006G0016 [Parcubacteria group bacterium GW2011_GWA2_40_37]|nr:MAG: hypothetical protein UU01_C0006G0016 [Parcubacteria group bacterium GW2011_GWA2_40_37]